MGQYFNFNYSFNYLINHLPIYHIYILFTASLGSVSSTYQSIVTHLLILAKWVNALINLL